MRRSYTPFPHSRLALISDKPNGSYVVFYRGPTLTSAVGENRECRLEKFGDTPRIREAVRGIKVVQIYVESTCYWNEMFSDTRVKRSSTYDKANWSGR